MRSYSIGRADENDIVLADKSVSRKHAELVDQGDGHFLLKDLGSAAGTHLYVDKHQSWMKSNLTEVLPDSRIRFGDHETTPAKLVGDPDRTVVRAKPQVNPQDAPVPAAEAAAALAAPSGPPVPRWKRILKGAGEVAAFIVVGFLMLCWEVLKVVFRRRRY